MFTGLVQKTGRVEKIKSSGNKVSLSISLGEMATDVRDGDSVMVSGVCLTATSIKDGIVTFDVVRETVSRTKLAHLLSRDKVNLELALRLSDRLGGHLVSGHVDGVGRIKSIRKGTDEVRVAVDAPPEVMRYLVEKGSVAVDGISLTVAALSAHGFEVAVIPWTLADTTLKDARVGDRVNLEGDMIGRWVAKFLTGMAGGGAREDSGSLAKKLRDSGLME